MVGDVPVNSEVFAVTSSISQDLPAQCFRCAHRDRMCVCALIRVNVRACCERGRLYYISQ